jgi:glycosyltransferase involved in cell wall biosynthesis
MSKEIQTSVIIPSRIDEFLSKTIEDILDKATNEIEVIVILDGYWCGDVLGDERVTYIHHGTQHNSRGMRDSINKGIALSRGKYIMKIDEHCMLDEGFDDKLAADCEDNWVVIPRRKRLDAEAWKLVEDGRRDIDYMYITYPYTEPGTNCTGLHGSEWKQRRDERLDVLIDDTPSMQGSCYFMTRKHWDKTIGFLDSTNYGHFTQEAQEIGMKTWLSGGRMVVNKKTWYAHFHKGKRPKGKGYGFSNQQYRDHAVSVERGRLYCIDYWLNTKDYPLDWNWFVTEKFPDMPGWTTDWRERVEKDKEKDYKNTGYTDSTWLVDLRK